MKIVSTELTDSYLKKLENSCICVCLNVPEEIRLRVRENLRKELILAGKIENEHEEKKRYHSKRDF